MLESCLWNTYTKRSGSSGLLLGYSGNSVTTFRENISDPSSRASKMGPIVCRLWHWKSETINIPNLTSLTLNISSIISYKLKVIIRAIDLQQLQRLYFVSSSRENLITVKFYGTLKRGKSNCMPCIRSLKKKSELMNIERKIHAFCQTNTYDDLVETVQTSLIITLFILRFFFRNKYQVTTKMF